MYTYPLFFGFPFHLGHHRTLGTVGSHWISVLCIVVYIFKMSIPISQFIPPPPSHPGIHMSILYVCFSISVLQIGSSVLFFYIPWICINIQYLFFSDFTLYDTLLVHPCPSLFCPDKAANYSHLVSPRFRIKCRGGTQCDLFQVTSPESYHLIILPRLSSSHATFNIHLLLITFCEVAAPFCFNWNVLCAVP